MALSRPVSTMPGWLDSDLVRGARPPGYLNLGHGARSCGSVTVAALRAPTARGRLDAATRRGDIRDLPCRALYGRAEEFLGEWLRDREPEGVTISSSGAA